MIQGTTLWQTLQRILIRKSVERGIPAGNLPTNASGAILKGLTKESPVGLNTFTLKVEERASDQANADTVKVVEGNPLHTTPGGPGL